MPKYYCDYCDVFLTHDAPSVRRDHNTGWKHQAAIRTYFQQNCNQEKMARAVGEIIKDYEERRLFVPIPMPVVETGGNKNIAMPPFRPQPGAPLLRPGMPVPPMMMLPNQLPMMMPPPPFMMQPGQPPHMMTMMIPGQPPMAPGQPPFFMPMPNQPGFVPPMMMPMHMMHPQPSSSSSQSSSSQQPPEM